MMIEREWADCPEVLEMMEDLAVEHEVHISPEQNSYGENGSVVIRIDGKVYSLRLREVV